jgi:hypothetical protein
MDTSVCGHWLMQPLKSPAMICPKCETEYREGFTRCADCDVDLVAELDEMALAPLTMESSPDLVAALIETLELERIPYVIQAGTAISVFDGEEDALDAPEPWHARIWVTPERADAAREILDEVRERTKESARLTEPTPPPPPPWRGGVR